MPTLILTRSNTLTLKPEQGTQIPTADFIEALIEQDIDTELTSAIQNIRNGEYDITFKDGVGKQTFLTQYKKGIQILNETYSIVDTPPIYDHPRVVNTNVFVSGLPVELDDNCIRGKLEGNGTLAGISRLTHKALPQIQNGTRKLVFIGQLTRHIPPVMFFKGLRARVNYTGQLIKCFNCGEVTSHKAAECKMANPATLADPVLERASSPPTTETEGNRPPSTETEVITPTATPPAQTATIKTYATATNAGSIFPLEIADGLSRLFPITIDEGLNRLRVEAERESNKRKAEPERKCWKTTKNKRKLRNGSRSENANL